VADRAAPVLPDAGRGHRPHRPRPARWQPAGRGEVRVRRGLTLRAHHRRLSRGPAVGVVARGRRQRQWSWRPAAGAVDPSSAADPDAAQARVGRRRAHPVGRWSGPMIKTGIKLIAFVAVCTVFTAYLWFTIGNVHLFEHTYSLSATFDDVTGLLPNDNVKVAGVP